MRCDELTPRDEEEGEMDELLDAVVLTVLYKIERPGMDCECKECLKERRCWWAKVTRSDMEWAVAASWDWIGVER